MVGVCRWSGKPTGAAELVPQTIDLLILVDGGLLEGADVIDGWWEDGRTGSKRGREVRMDNGRLDQHPRPT